ncbi:MAG: hypothetical protein LZF62_50004 [Nitrospira sp.]|nr:MAG: hypothetical protein LZF62_50004 [Nitrospira sp.]
MRKLLKQNSREMGLNVCTHGDVHLQYNGMTLHFDAKQFNWFAKSVAQLFERYQQRFADRPSPVTPLIQTETYH